MTPTLISHRFRTVVTRVISLALLACAPLSNAFVVNSYVSGTETLYLKWGDNHAGSLGGIVHWSFIPAGTPGSAYCADACPGNSVDSINIEISPGGGFASVPLVTLEARITAMLAVWSAATGIQFVKLNSDSGAPINDPTATPPATGQIRFGVFQFGIGAGGAAVGYAPPPNGGTGAGDILFNAGAYFQFAPGNEGDAFDQTYAPNDFDSLVLHELGHAIGLAHPPNDGSCPVMCVAPTCLGIVNRQLGADDMGGARFLYDTLFINGFE